MSALAALSLLERAHVRESGHVITGELANNKQVQLAYLRFEDVIASRRVHANCAR